MGYDLHITRAENWLENQGREISKEEWLALVHEDPELTPDPTNGDCAVLWQGECSRADPWFDWYDGNVYTSDPDREVLAKSLEMAARLQAHVQGDDGVRYETPAQWAGH